jgi:SAM-dependent MidA family methyltransferase
MADLATRIARRIRREGPLSIAAFMAMALHDPESGYYARHDPLGRAGDFITAPEISQIFGELIGLWCADFWWHLGRPDPVMLVERLGARRRPGILSGLFLIGYAVARMSGELFRQPDVQLGFLIFGTTMGQLLSIPLLIGGIALIGWAWRQPPVAAAASQ